jgi:hypothetical protein
MFLTDMPESMKQGANAVVPWAVIIVAALLLWYAWSMEKKGVLR